MHCGGGKVKKAKGVGRTNLEKEEETGMRTSAGGVSMGRQEEAK